MSVRCKLFGPIGPPSFRKNPVKGAACEIQKCSKAVPHSNEAGPSPAWPTRPALNLRVNLSRPVIIDYFF
jgi:hypothetical protein